MKHIAFFDFDGTITRKDTLIEFIKFAKGSWYYYFGICLLSPFLFLYLLRVVPNHSVKKILFNFFFENETRTQLEDTGKRFCTEILPSLLRPGAMQKLLAHKRNGDTVCVVSASFDVWLTFFCTTHDLQLICTELRYENETYRGEWATANCNGAEKANRIRAKYDLGSYEKVYAYGDTQGDAAMLDLASEKFYRVFV